MKGICFVEPLFNKVIREEKTQTRRITIDSKVDLSLTEREKLLSKARYRVGGVIYLKEPYCDDLVIDEIFYKYDNLNLEIPIWKNKLFMPESVARYFIKITKVTLERLQNISREDCFKEGITQVDERSYTHPYYKGSWSTPQRAYAHLINYIDGLEIWDKNPYVYVYDFHLVKN